MKPTRDSTYIKHVYWMTRDEEKSLRETLTAANIKIRTAKGVVCSPLDPVNRISTVAPGVWNETCFRQGSWYRASEKNGLYLIISSFPLEGYERLKAATITESDFVPSRMATLEEKEALVRELSEKNIIPPEWPQVGETEKRIYLRWAKRLGSDTESYDFLYLCHTANHANFINPRFFVQQGSGIIPYSIERSAHLCSCCAELFQILGSDYKEKLVAPCPGATIFARLKTDRYLLVKRG